MNDIPQSGSVLSPNKQALLKIRELKQQLAEAQDVTSDGIAIVSMACRFPRRSLTPEQFWECLIQGSDEVTEIPPDRWDLEAFYDADPDVPGKMYARRGVFLDNLDLMDPEFFGISPREATWVDPQQRLLLEVGWEALERAGWSADKIGQGSGIFVGWMHNDYQNEASDSFLNLNPYIATGAAGSFLCGRLAYYLGLEGPSVAVDTACSSSLVALHLACQSLQRRECDRALVGGVNAIASPTTNILTCKLNALSPTGQSRAFDARADGYVRGEGCGVVTLRRLADAERAGDPILAVIRGSSVGHNGGGAGLTVPNPRAQERVIRQALQQARIEPAEVDYLEAHGTGTELGDPIEIQAAAAALAQARSNENRLLVGSVKTNIGHLEAAAGMAGLIKVLLAFENGLIPAQINFEQPNPHIPWDRLPIDIVVQPTDWPGGERRVAGVSAFGMSGTNAHVVLEAPGQGAGHIAHRFSERLNTRMTADNESPKSASTGGNTTSNQLIVLSAQSEEALQDLAGKNRQWLSSRPDTDLGSIAHTLGAGRKHLEVRAALVADNLNDTLESLELLERSDSGTHVFRGRTRGTPKIAWQFTGQGSQYVGMTQGLYDSQPVFRDALNACDELVRQWRGESLLEVVFHKEAQLNHTSWTQPALFAIQRGLAQLLNSWGLAPDLVLGHSVGQYAAACVAGILSWNDGLRLICERGRLIGDLPAGGAMVAVFAPADEISRYMDSTPQLSLAANNGSHTVISGPEQDVDKLVSMFKERNVRCKRLITSHAFHSSLMDPALDPFQQVADSLTANEARIPLVCNITGEILPHDKVISGQYWRQHIREAVQYAQSIRSVQDFGCEVLLELGPQPVLTGMAAANWAGDKSKLICCQQQDGLDEQQLLQAVGQLYTVGVTPDFSKLECARYGKRIVLPTYPFQRRRFWGPAKPRAAHAEFHTEHPLLGGKCQLAGLPNETRFESFIAEDSPAWMPDHEVMGEVVFPGAAFVELARAAAGSLLQDLVFEQPLRPRGRTAVQTVIRKADDDQPSLEVYSSSAGSSAWSRHFRASVKTGSSQIPEPLNLDAIRAGCDQTARPEDFYRTMQGLGLNYGPQFQTIQALDYSNQEVLAHLRTAADLRGYAIPPTLLDGALHSLAVGLLQGSDSSLFLPVGMRQFECFGSIEGDAWCHAEWVQPEGDVRTANLTLTDTDGRVIARITELKLRRLDRAAIRKMSGSGAQRLVYDLKWQNYRLPAGRTDSHDWLVVGSGDERQQQTTGLLRDRGHQVIELHLGKVNGQTQAAAGTFECACQNNEDWTALLDEIRLSNPEFTPEGVVWLLENSGAVANSEELDDRRWSASELHCTGLLGLVSALRAKEIRRLECGFQLITRHGIPQCNLVTSDVQQNVERTDSASCESPPVDPWQAQYWGLGRVIGAEQPEFQCRLIDFDFDSESGEDVRLLRDLILNDTPESQVAIHGGQYWIPRLKPTSVAAEPTPAKPIVVPGASYLITGGLGMLGRQAALWLASHGADQVVLVSRRPPAKEAVKFIEGIEAHGCSVDVHQADLSSRADVEALFERFGGDLPELRGVIHAAGVLDDGLLKDQSWERFEKVMAPKVHGASWLHEFSRELPLDFFVLYSSAAAVLGSPGQSNYATANAFLDGLAWMRRSMGLPALSVNWGPWTEGMADDENIVKRLALQGITPLSVSEAHDALEKMLSGELQQATVMDVDWRRMNMGMGGETPSLLAELIPAARQSRQGDSELVGKLKTLAENERRSLLLDSIRSDLQDILSTPDAPETDRPLIEMGLDSLMAVEFGTRLQQQLGDEFAIAPTMLFDHPTIDAITDHVLELLSSMAGTESEQSVEARLPDVRPTPPDTKEDVAIIGMSCRFPGAASLDEFWNNLLDGVDSVSEIPEDRWEVDRFYDPDGAPGKMVTREGGFLRDIANFDADFFGISEQEACWIDPQHRLLLETSWTALEEAGIAASQLDDKNVGVFMGIMSSDYAFLPSLEDEGIVQSFQGAGFAHSAGVGRISHVFGFEGPSLAIDSASSSSLVAVCQAMKSLQDGNCNMALAGGVNAILAPVNSLLMSKAGLLAPDGRSKSFSADANGFGRGEGCGVIVLKRVSDAQRDSDHILAVIRGGAISHNGFAGAITAPSSKAQVKVISEAYKNAGIAPTAVQYLEAHGTGTAFGDPMEIGAAMSVLGKGRRKDNPLLVGSVKANISHLEAAGGISGLIKTVLAMQHGVIPRQIHFERPSPHIPWARLPLKVVTELTDWPEGQQRIAGVTALGLSGTNAHVVLSAAADGAEPAPETEPDRSHHLLVLSGRDEAALVETAHRFQGMMSGPITAPLADVCYTAAVGRQHFKHRAALVVSSLEQVADRLNELTGNDIEARASTMVGENAKPNGKPKTPSTQKGQVSGTPTIAWHFGSRLAGAQPAVSGLYRGHPTFRKAIDRYDAILRELADGSAVVSGTAPIKAAGLAEWLDGQLQREEDSGVELPDTWLFAVQAALCALWESWGIEPDVVLGFGVGQISAVCAAGGLAVEDALSLVWHRQQVRSVLGLRGDESLPEPRFSADGQDALKHFESAVDRLNFYPPNRPLVCSLSGEIVPVHRSLAGSYWRKQCTEPALIDCSLQTLASLNNDYVLDIGTGATLENDEQPATLFERTRLVVSLNEQQQPMETMLSALGSLYVGGFNPNFAAVDAPWVRRKISLPTYPFRRKRYWITELAEHAGK